MLISKAPGNSSIFTLFGIFKSSHFRSYASAIASAENSVAHLEKLVQKRCKSRNLTVEEALGYFNSMIQMRPMPSIWAFNQMLGALSKMKHHSTAISMYREMMGCHDFGPGISTLNVVMRCFCCLQMVKLGFSVLATIIKTGLRPDAHTLNALLHGLCEEGSMVAAMELLRKMEENDLPCNEVSYATVINGFCKAQETGKALDLLAQMYNDERLKPNHYCFNPIIDNLCKEGQMDEALRLFRDMTNCGVLPNVVCYNTLLHGLCKFRRWEEARRLTIDMLDSGISPNVITYATLIKGYCVKGEIDKAHEILEQMTLNGIMPNVMSYCTLVESYINVERIGVALKLLKDMIRRGFLPDHIHKMQSFLAMICAKRREAEKEMIGRGFLPDQINKMRSILETIRADLNKSC